MSGTYFTILAVLVAAGFFVGSGRARAARNTGALHSLPTYHGLFIAAAVLTAMMAIYVVGAPLASHYVASQGLGAFDPAAVSEQL
jgi:phosphate transport system permease protein